MKMEDYENFCKKQLARIQGESIQKGISPPAQHKNISLIHFNGVPVLSPLLTLERKKELQQDRKKAVDLELWRQNSKKIILLNRVQEIVENVQMKKLSSQHAFDQFEMENIHTHLKSKVANGFKTQSNSALPSSTTLGGFAEPKIAPEVKSTDLEVALNGDSLGKTEQFIPHKPKDSSSSLSEKRVCPEGASSDPTQMSPLHETVKKDSIEIVSADAEGPDPCMMSLQNLLKKSREYIQREQTRRSLRSNSRRNGSESHSDKENDAVKTSDAVKERGKLTGRSGMAVAPDKSSLAKSSTSLQSTSVAKNNTSVTSTSFSKVDIPMRSGTPPVLDSDEDLRSTSFFEHDSRILHSFTGSYSKLPSPELSMSPKMHRRRPRPSSMGHIVINNPVNAYELSPKEKGRAADQTTQDAGNRRTASDLVPTLAADVAPICPSKVHVFCQSSSEICDELGLEKQNQVCQPLVGQRGNTRLPVSATAEVALISGDRGVLSPCLLEPSAQDTHAVSSIVVTQSKADAAGAKQTGLLDGAQSSPPMELNKSYDVESPSPLLIQTHQEQMDTPNESLGNEPVLENGFGKVKRRLELDADNAQKENIPCVIAAETNAREKRWLPDQRCPVGSAFGSKLEAPGRNVREEETFKQKMLAFEELRKRLEEQHAQQLSLLIAEQEREQERLQKEIEEQEWRLKGEKTAVTKMDIPQIAISSRMDLEWRKISDTQLLESVLTRVETIHSTNSETAGFANTSISCSTADSPFYLWEPPAHGKSVAASRSISRSRMRWSQVYSPEMKRKLNKISALAKGFLTRRLLQTEKLKHLRQTVKDTMEFIKNFQTEAPLKRGSVSAQDANLQERVAAQLRAALYDIHDIFFKMDVSERMSLLCHDREVRKEKMLRQLDKAKAPRERVTLSTATQKSLDRKKYMKASEMGMPNRKTIVKQKTPENRVLQPNQGQNAPIQRLLSRQGTPKTSVKGAEQNRKKPSESRVSNKAFSGVYAGRIQRKKPNAVTT